MALSDVNILGTTPRDLRVGRRDPAADVGDWAHARFSSRGLDPHGALDTLPFVAEPGSNAAYYHRVLKPEFDIDKPAYVGIGQELLDAARPGAAGAERGTRVLATAGAHEAAHAVDASIRPRGARTGEAGTVAEHVADVLGMTASDTITDRAALVQGEVGRPAPRSAAQYVNTFLDRGGVHHNTVFLNDAALAAREQLGSAQLGAIYLDAIEHAPRSSRISQFAHETVKSAARLHGRGSAQVRALDQAWTGVGLTRAMRHEGVKLRSARGLAAGYVTDLRIASPAMRTKLLVRAGLPLVLVSGAATGVALLARHD